jgi:hypothetical protein
METYSINDMAGFAKAIRDGAAESITPDYTEDLDDFITIPQVQSLIITRSLGKDSYNNYIINENIFDDIFENIRDTIYQTGLSKLAAKGIIECAWDTESNSMVFWMNSSTKGYKEIDSLPHNYDE